MANDDRTFPLPSVPDGDQPAVFAAPDLTEVVPELNSFPLGPEEPALDVLAWGPAVVPASVLFYAAEGEDGVARIENVIRERARELETRRISKEDALYLPASPIPPIFWEYRCRTCRFYQRRRGTTPKCEVVGQQGDPLGGRDIHPEAWCALWLPQEDRAWFEWAADRLEGDA